MAELAGTGQERSRPRSRRSTNTSGYDDEERSTRGARVPTPTWDQLMCQTRLRPGAEPRSVFDGRSPFESDHERVVFASSFRRLDGKAQVFSQVDHSYLRTRLPHSLEVAALGTAMAISAMEYLSSHRILLLPSARDAGAVIGTACLLHDIGNPPFGHKGEEAIRIWAQGALGGLPNDERADFENFDGNAQSFRVAVRLQNSGKPGGLNLTAASLSALVKYPWGSSRCSQLGKSKFGAFLSDLPSFEEVRELTGLGGHSKHPLAILMEAADDLANSVSDVEDAVRYEKVAFDDVMDRLGHGDTESKALAEHASQRKAEAEAFCSRQDAEHRAIQHLRSLALGHLRSACVEEFVGHYDEIVAGTYSQPLVKNMAFAPLREILSTIVKERVFNNPEVLEREERGAAAITRVLERRFAEAPEPNRRSQLAASSTYAVSEAYLHAQDAIDYVVGMTDEFLIRQGEQ